MRLQFVRRGALLTLLAAAALPAGADSVTFNFQSVFSGAAPAGAGPWLTATFVDVTPGTVRLQVSASGLTGNEGIESLYFNVAPSMNAAALTFTRDAASTGPTAAQITIGQGVDLYRADGDGYYDILFDLPPPPGQEPARFSAGESLIYMISGSGLSAASFLFLSTPGPGGGPGPQYAAAHIQQIGATNISGWVAGAPPAPVPLPAAGWLLLSAAGLAWVTWGQSPFSGKRGRSLRGL
jgi:hypothetical protein